MSGRCGSSGEVFRAFLKLGLTSFGGPIAHLGYFRREFVTKRGWLDEDAYGGLVALASFLPGPTSSQVGFALGILRAGWPGGLAAWAAFTLPSAAAMGLVALVADRLDGDFGSRLVHGLKLVAVAVVAQAVCEMARRLTPDFRRASIAVGAGLLILAWSNAVAQFAAIAAGSAAGLVLCRDASIASSEAAFRILTRRAGLAALLAFAGLLVALPALAALSGSRDATLIAAVYRVGALVFGGGHVMLPLLEQAVVQPGWVTTDAVLAGYGVVQGVPGPLFSLAAFVGTLAASGGPNLGCGLACVLAIFAPGLLLMLGALPFWEAARRHPIAAPAAAGASSAVVGLLAGALYDPVWTTSIAGAWDVAIAALGFTLLTATRMPPLVVVAVVTCLRFLVP